MFLPTAETATSRGAPRGLPRPSRRRRSFAGSADSPKTESKNDCGEASNASTPCSAFDADPINSRVVPVPFDLITDTGSAVPISETSRRAPYDKKIWLRRKKLRMQSHLSCAKIIPLSFGLAGSPLHGTRRATKKATAVRTQPRRGVLATRHAVPCRRRLAPCCPLKTRVEPHAAVGEAGSPKSR
jgi:hypothetical protein